MKKESKILIGKITLFIGGSLRKTIKSDLMRSLNPQRPTNVTRAMRSQLGIQPPGEGNSAPQTS